MHSQAYSTLTIPQAGPPISDAPRRALALGRATSQPPQQAETKTKAPAPADQKTP